MTRYISAILAISALHLGSRRVGRHRATQERTDSWAASPSQTAELGSDRHQAAILKLAREAASVESVFEERIVPRGPPTGDRSQTLAQVGIGWSLVIWRTNSIAASAASP